MKLTNVFIQSQVSGIVQKTCWSMLWQRSQLSVNDVVKKGYKENSVRKAFNKFVQEGWAIKPDNTRNIIQIKSEITKC